MTWRSIDSKLKKKHGRNFIACEEWDERAFIINLIKETLPYYARIDIEQAVDRCCLSVPVPRERGLFLQCVRNRLEEEA